MTRMYITGGPGSGKTTLAKRISSQLTLPCYEMDLIGWENGVGAERPLVHLSGLRRKIVQFAREPLNVGIYITFA